MKAQIVGFDDVIGKYTGKPVTSVFLKGEDGKSYITWLDPQNGNFQRWPKIKVGMVLANLNIKKGNLIDADSFPREVHNAPII